MPWRRATVSARSRLHGERKLEPFEDISVDDRVREALEAMPWRRRTAITLTESLHLTAGEAGRALRMRARRIREEIAAASTDLSAALADDEEPTEPTAVLDAVRLAAAPAAGAFARHLSLRRRTRDRRRVAAVACALSLAALVVFLGSRGSTTGTAGRRIADSRAGCARRRHLPSARHLGRGHGDAPRRMAGRRFDLGLGRPRVRRGDDRTRRWLGERGCVRPRAPEPGRSRGTRLHADTSEAASVVRRVRRRVRTRGPAPVAIAIAGVADRFFCRPF